MSKLTSEKIANILAGANKSSKEMEISFNEIDSFGDDSSLRKMFEDIDKYNRMLQQRITLINDPLTAAVPFTRENLYLFCSYTGSGKSTTAANISYPLWKQGKKALVLSNEESQQDVLFRIAAIELGLNFNDYKKGKMSDADKLRAMGLFPDIARYIKVLDVTFKNGFTTKVEGIKSALDAIKTSDYSCVMIDYYQLIKYSNVDQSKTAYENLNDLRVWMGLYIKNSNVPIVLFAQLYSISKRGGAAKDIDARIKDCSAIVEPATVIIEVAPNFENSTSDFIIHKDRFGLAGHKITCGFEKGRYIKITPDEIAHRTLANITKKSIQNTIASDNE